MNTAVLIEELADDIDLFISNHSRLLQPIHKIHTAVDLSHKDAIFLLYPNEYITREQGFHYNFLPVAPLALYFDKGTVMLDSFLFQLSCYFFFPSRFGANGVPIVFY